VDTGARFEPARYGHNVGIMRTRAIPRPLPLLLALLVLPLGAQPATRAPAPQPANVKEDALNSVALGRTLPYRVILPVGYASSTTRYPALYLLHGYGGDYTNWTMHSKVVAAAAPLALLIVTPEGGNSWYVNGENGEKWESYIAEDLVADVERKYRAAAGRNGHAIAGLSMGGYAAIRIGLRRPGEFAFAASLSGAFDITRENDVFTRGNHVDLTPIFGKPGSMARRDNDVYALIAHADPKQTPYVYLVEGTRDRWLEPNRDVARALSIAGIPYEYHETPGTHDWTFWDREIGPILTKIKSYSP
jgi:putative tributyrin esterase